MIEAERPLPPSAGALRGTSPEGEGQVGRSMGNVGSHSEGEEEEEEEAAGGRAAAAANGGSSSSSEASPVGSMNPPAAAPDSPPSSAFPPAAVLLGQSRLREAAASRLREAPSTEPLLSRHHAALVRWLEERLARGEETVSLEQLCEALESRAGPAAAAAVPGSGSGGAAAGGTVTASSAAEERAFSEEVRGRGLGEGGCLPLSVPLRSALPSGFWWLAA